MPLRRLISVLAALPAVWTLSCQSLAAQERPPFDATFRLAPTAFESERYIDAYGELRIRVLKTCTGWELRERLMLTVVEPGTVERAYLRRYIGEEPGPDGDRLRFARRRESTDGSVETESGQIPTGGGRDGLVLSNGGRIALPPETKMPLAFRRNILDRMEQGAGTYSEVVAYLPRFSRPVKTDVAIGPALNLIDPVVARVIDETEAALRESAPGIPYAVVELPPGDVWPVRLEFNTENEPSGKTDREGSVIEMRIHQSGVPLAILFSFADIDIQGDLMSLAFVPEPVCSQ